MKDYIRQVVAENYGRSDGFLPFDEWLASELEYNIEGFDCFFETSFDELLNAGKDERKELILSIFE